LQIDIRERPNAFVSARIVCSENIEDKDPEIMGEVRDAILSGQTALPHRHCAPL
jgi:hypothetical protein